MSENTIEKLLKQLKFALNSQSRTPQEWVNITNQLGELARKAQSRIIDVPTLERVELSTETDVVIKDEDKKEE